MAIQLSGNDVAESERQGDSDLESVGGGEARGGLRRSGRLGNFLLAFGCWGLFSLVAIAFIGTWPYLGLAIALIGGVILGFVCMMRFESKL